jgi:signal transduction histidine kinase
LVQIGVYELTSEEIDFLKIDGSKRLSTIYNLAIQYKNNENIRLAVDKASRIIMALKTYVHFDSSNVKQNVDIVKGIDTVLTIYQNVLKKGITIIKEFEISPEIMGFADKLNQVWTNLLTNAMHAMDHKGTLTICLKKVEGENAALVSFADSGHGIPLDIRGRVFDAFFTTKAMGEGSGLGLDIVKKIVEEHNGTIWFESEIGKGTVFYIKFSLIE